MENQDKIYEQFKEAAGKTEQKGFDRMEAVWNRVEEKLDENKKRTPIAWWKYTGAAAVILLFIGLGNLLMRNDANPVVIPNTEPERVVNTVIDTQKVNETFNPAATEIIEEEIVLAPNNDTNKASGGKTTQPEMIKYKVVSSNKENTITVSGTVNDNVGPLPFATVQVKGENLSIQTDMDGKFTVTTKLNDTLILSYPTSRSKEIIASLSNKKTSIILESKPLNELTVDRYSSGYSDETTIVNNISNQNLKASVSNMATSSPNASNQYPAATANRYPVKKEQLAPGYLNPQHSSDKDAEVADGKVDSKVIQNLQGQVAGLNIATGSGQPGAETTVMIRGAASIRGNSEPLYVIDGIPVDYTTIAALNQNDIESVNVLKDASATSLYGSRGANGVVVVKTKSGLSKQDLRTIKREYKKRKKELKNQINSSESIPFAPIKPNSIKIDTEEYESFEENQFENTAISPLSTFSIDVDNASYTNVRRFLNNGQTVPKDAVRVEEMINFFKYEYVQPKDGTPFAMHTEYGTAPWNPKHTLLKIGLKGKDIPTASLPASNFVFLIDVSGSMNDSNKLPLLKQSMKLLVNQMRQQDRIAIVVYAGAAGLVLPSTSGAEKNTIINALDELEAGGSTAGGAGIELAYKTAQENFVKGGNNRVILATDGDFNVGASSNSDMQTLIEAKRKSGVFLTCLGYGMGNYKDSKMEILADKGNGNYAYIDNMQEADRFLQKEFKGSMFAIAKDVKIQIEFNPKHVQSYRLIGYENRKLRDEDFANDAIDAGELGSGHTVTALYEIIPVGVESSFFTPAPELKYGQPVKTSGNFSNELATIKFRYKKPDEDKSKEIVKVIPNVTVLPGYSTADFNFAAAVAWFGLKLRDSKLIPNKETKAIIDLAKQGQQPDPEGYRAEFIRLVNMVE